MTEEDKKGKKSSRKTETKGLTENEGIFDDESGLPVQELKEALTPVSHAERSILIVDEEGQRRNETETIVKQILPNATIDSANDPEEASLYMQNNEYDTYVVNFLMPGYSSSAFVKDICNHPDRPLLIGFAADKMSDAVDPKKGLKIIPLKRLFELTGDSTMADDSEE